ncbi:MAG TPA: ADP-ribosylglycohydrolase family protein [Candidatus Atribacteria bacterium]|nr:ADP-ribosylglycohydrolase family protein [Candidatus Atribacteria bacterium]
MLSDNEYYDKVYGCWLGKNAGGTLGTPLESGWGQEEMFDVWWYPKLEEGGLPNDDLELQLIWLQALEDRGLHITARDLAEYWLDCIAYNFDEYGLNKTNLKKGLVPPVSGYFNNWFKHCMGSPIRSEIWACIAPGLPNVAAKYAYEDAIVDHAGGESVYGEIFNAAVESSAFVISDKMKLLEIGLSFIPEHCETAKAIRNAITAYEKGMDWKEARNFVWRNSYSPIAQYSPVNLGFQTIGWLYGEDFGDAICKAVNCGYDTDCTGATLGAMLGIILGRSGLPEKWVEPLSDRIATNSSWGGIKNVREPENLDELTRRVCKIGKKVLALFGDDSDPFIPEEETKKLWYLPPTRIDYDLKTVSAGLDYIDSPAIQVGSEKKFNLIIKNPHPETLEAEVSCRFPEKWDVSAEDKKIVLKSGEEITIPCSVRVGDIKSLQTSNRGSISISVKERPQIPDIPVVYLGSNRWLISKRYDGNINTETELEKDPNPSGPGEHWRVVNFDDNELNIEPYFEGKPGIIYLRHYIYTAFPRPLRVGLPSNCPFQLWLNGEKIHEVESEGILRPNYGGDGRSYVVSDFREGWNQILAKLERKDKPVEAHFILATGDKFSHGIVDVIECKFPWEIL